MPTISLAPYTVRVKRRGGKAFLPLGQLGPGDDAFELFTSFFEDLKTRHDPASKTLFRLAKKDFRNRVLEGILETGEYGYETDLVDVAARPPKVTHHRKASEAELLPFYFRLGVPKQADQGILILQRFGSLGVKVALETALADFFAKTPYLVKLYPLVPEQVIEQWTHATQVRRLRLVNFEVPKTITRAFQLEDTDEVCSELVIRAKRGHTFHIPRRLKSKDGFVEIQDEQEIKELRRDLGIFGPDALKLDVRVDGRTRTLDLTDPGSLVAYHDVTQAVSPLDASGHPAWDKIREAGRDLAATLDITVQKLPPAESPTVPSRSVTGRRLELARKAG